jgi:hypothetical protein
MSASLAADKNLLPAARAFFVRATGSVLVIFKTIRLAAAFGRRGNFPSVKTGQSASNPFKYSFFVAAEVTRLKFLCHLAFI